MPSRNTPSEQSGAGNNAASGGEASSSDASGGKTANCAEADSAEPENAPRAGAPKRRRTGRSFWLVVLLFAWLFADVLAADANLAFRDAAHFYHPLLQYVRQSWYRGEVPLWNPWENFGEPLAASPTAMVFYPGSVLLLAPIPYDWAYKLFILAHLVLAAWGAACVARRYGRSPAAATLAALAYAGSGHVLFQHCNPIYLVGAAWLPLAWLAIDRLVHARSVRAAASLAVVMAMIVLGGDPHLAYNAGLAALLLVWLKRRSVPQVPGSRWRQFAHHPLCLLAFSALLAVSLSAVQLAPALRLSQRSERGPADVPRNLYELSATALSGTLEHDGPVPWYAVLVGKPAPPEMHLGNLYDFSIGPWRLAELVWPNVGGQAFPQRQRWFDAIPAERRYWTVSL